MEQNQFDAIVIGSGPGGAAAAALLQHRGVNTLLVEKNNFLGGKMVSIERDGYAYDLFPHGQVPMRAPAFKDVYDEIGIGDRWEAALECEDDRNVITLAYRRHDWKDYNVVSQPQAMADPRPFFKLWKLDDPADQMKAMQFMTEMLSTPEDQMDELDAISMHDYMQRFDVPYEVYSYMAFHANASIAEPIDKVAASEQIRIMRHMMVHGGGGQYRGGFAKLARDMVARFEELGGTLIKNCKVDHIIVEDGRAVGIQTRHGEFRAPVVISSAGIQPTALKLVEPGVLPEDYVDYVKKLEPGWGFTSIRYFLDRPVMDVAMYVVYSDDSWWNQERHDAVRAGHKPDEVILFMVNHTFYDENAAPPGKQVLVSGTICSSDPEDQEIEHLWSVMDKQMVELFPEIWDACERREYAGPKEISTLTRD
ncbi:MAG: FAD-dependent oxidoreductase, partial [Candidatus Dadabacteria bacterium]